MTDKERLENMSPVGFDLNGNVLLKSEDYHWLMEQTERIEELEEERDEWKDTAQSYYVTNQELKEQNQRYRKALEEIRDEESEPHLFNDRQRVYTMTGRIALEALEGEK
jgi:hypothetical protein